MRPRSAKAKGTRLEKDIAGYFRALGIEARRQPGSGIYSDFPHDVYAVLGGGHETVKLVIECKSWKAGWRTGDKAMGQADLLVIRADRSEPKVYMPWTTFSLLAQAAHAYFGVGGMDEETRAALAELDSAIEDSGYTGEEAFDLGGDSITGARPGVSPPRAESEGNEPGP